MLVKINLNVCAIGTLSSLSCSLDIETNDGTNITNINRIQLDEVRSDHHNRLLQTKN